jgi:hypothetical protein
MKQGTRIIFLDHPDWRGGRFWGYEGEIVTAHYLSYDEMSVRKLPHSKPVIDYYIVSVPWMTKFVFARPDIICPVYNDCEVCGYAAWGSVNRGTEKEPEWHHFCAWHLPVARNGFARKIIHGALS